MEPHQGLVRRALRFAALLSLSLLPALLEVEDAVDPARLLADGGFDALCVIAFAAAPAPSRTRVLVGDGQLSEPEFFSAAGPLKMNTVPCKNSTLVSGPQLEHSCCKLPPESCGTDTGNEPRDEESRSG